MSPNLENKINVAAIGGGVKSCSIIEQACFAGDRSGFLQKKWKIHFQMSCLGIKPLLHGGEDFRNIFHMHHVAVGI